MKLKRDAFNRIKRKKNKQKEKNNWKNDMWKVKDETRERKKRKNGSWINRMCAFPALSFDVKLWFLPVLKL